MSTHYLEFDSATRNRNQYPNPASFTVEISQTGQKSNVSALDPVCNSSPILSWNSSFDETAAATSVTITAIDYKAATPAPSLSSPSTFVITAAANDLRNVLNYYTGAILVLYDSTTTVRTRILSYQRISTTQAQVTVETSLPNSFPAAALADSYIMNPTGVTNTDTVPKVFIPGVEFHANNFYVNYLIHNITTNESFTITAYDGTTHMATISGNTAATWNTANQNFVIRKELPTNSGTIRAINSPASTITTPAIATSRAIQLASTATNIPDAYVGGFLRMTEPVPTTAGFSTTVSPYGEERRIVRYVVGDGFLAFSAGGTTVTLNASTSSSVDNFYVGAILTDVAVGVSAEIIGYTGATRTVTLAVALVGSATNNVWQIRTVILANAFGTPPVVGAADTYEVEAFSRDNCTPFVYYGSLVSVQEMCCYEVELINLTLPNTVLASGRGGRAVFYPYMYTELQQVSASSGNQRGLIYSNNPIAYKMMFRAVLDDTSTFVASPFIKIDGDGMVQTVKFKPTDSFKFSVYLPGGDLFRTVATDTASPTEPNPLCQISACFSFRKVS